MAGNNVVKKLGVAISVGALTFSGLAAMNVGSAGAAKPVLKGTLHCITNGSITFTPNAVLAPSQLPNGQDGKITMITTTTLSGCTGSEPTSGLPVPTSATATTKTKSKTRMCTSLMNVGNKTKYAFPGGAKSKLRPRQGTTVMKVDNGTPLVRTDDIAIPLPSAPGFSAFFEAHRTNGIVITTLGAAMAGKSYAGRSVQMFNRAAAWQNLLSVCGQGLGLHSMQFQGVIGIGVPA